MSNKRIRSRNRQALDKVLDGHRAFINFNAQMLMSDLVDILPADKVILEILETVGIANQDRDADDPVRRNCTVFLHSSSLLLRPWTANTASIDSSALGMVLLYLGRGDDVDPLSRRRS
jgi:hypothetical protein